jgi:hypothetical protein
LVNGTFQPAQKFDDESEKRLKTIIAGNKATIYAMMIRDESEK